MNREHRKSLRRAFDHPRPDRQHERDRFSLLLPYGMPITATVRELASDLGIAEIVQNPWPDRLTRAHAAAKEAGHDVDQPVVWVERYTRPTSTPNRKLRVRQLGALLTALARDAAAPASAEVEEADPDGV